MKYNVIRNWKIRNNFIQCDSENIKNMKNKKDFYIQCDGNKYEIMLLYISYFWYCNVVKIIWLKKIN